MIWKRPVARASPVASHEDGEEKRRRAAGRSRQDSERQPACRLPLPGGGLMSFLFGVGFGWVLAWCARIGGCKHFTWSPLFQRFILCFNGVQHSDDWISQFRYCPECGKEA